MEITAFSLTGIYWDDHGWDGKAELTVHADLVGRHSPVTLKFEGLDQPAEMQALFDAFGLHHQIKLVTESTHSAETDPSKDETTSVPVTEDNQQATTKSGPKGQQEAKPIVAGERLQPVDETQDFDPETVGSAVAEHLASTTKVDKAAPKLNVPSALPSQGHPKPFTATDFEQQPTNQQTVNQPTIFGADGDKLTREEVDDTPASDSLPGL
ncbi:hypothetical protein IMAU80100_02466 [Lactiplantibacillus plantarum]|uniref:Uncharacterized protein n=1 Tax=Lactiplantibacillus pentosus TaxID=1589 RepID=A0ABX5D2Y7_LACPE|nr:MULTISPECIES: hypothetical protein [Lactiplantibacillus]ALG27434.1 hypothetical protein AN634_15850 [Lactiplantibacillus plantarum]MCG0596414.1 hypothetical protein [Lactiplantibacillus plantarum]MCG0637609.1 hypothetical protein [Lactiplantibacillus plantarum]MCG0643780.1 hypothetical protein [Lactiplantibacillus plantarum]MCG0646855.1 hypothetical protein [Lactiplantibacillus plantarum]